MIRSEIQVKVLKVTCQKSICANVGTCITRCTIVMVKRIHLQDYDVLNNIKEFLTKIIFQEWILLLAFLLPSKIRKIVLGRGLSCRLQKFTCLIWINLFDSLTFLPQRFVEGLIFFSSDFIFVIKCL